MSRRGAADRDLRFCALNALSVLLPRSVIIGSKLMPAAKPHDLDRKDIHVVRTSFADAYSRRCVPISPADFNGPSFLADAFLLYPKSRGEGLDPME